MPSAPELPRGNLDGWLLQIHRHRGLGCQLSRSLPTGLLWILEYENVGWQEPACLGAAEQPHRLPKFGLTAVPPDRMERTGSIAQLENSEFGSRVPQNFHPVAPGQLLQGDEMQLELRKGTSLVGDTW